MTSNSDDEMFGNDFLLEEVDNLFLEIDKKQLESSNMPTPMQPSVLAPVSVPAPSPALAPAPAPENSLFSTNHQKINPKNTFGYRHCIILSIIYVPDPDYRPRIMEKILFVSEISTEKKIRVHVKGEWVSTYFDIGWLMNIPLGDGSSNITVDDEQNFIVMLPHILLSATDIAGASSCTRRVVLGQKTKRTFELSRPIVHGEILHRVIQDLMSIRDFSMATIKSTLWKSICYHRERLFLIDEDENMAYTLLLECVDSLSRFGTMYIHPEPQQHGVLEKDLRAHLIEEQGFKTVCIQRVVGIEELLWSKLYGIRGMVDATVEIKSLPNNKVLTIPLELKTGRINRDISHRTQTMLYALLMSDRYETDMKFSALYYSRTNSLSLIDGSIDIPRLIRVRNRLATAINRKSRLPPVVKNPFDCKKCHYSNQCFMYHRAIEKGNAKTSGAPEVFNSSAGHMTERYQKFFREWMSLIDLEEKDMGNLRRVNWSHTGDDIERKGVGFDHMLIQESYYKDNHTHYVFSRDPASEQAKEKKPLYASRLEVQDLLVISSTQGHSNLGAGTLVAIDHDTITIRTTTQLRKVPKKAHDFNEKDNQVYDYIQETDKGMAYRIERDPAFYTMSLLRTNIILLLSKAKHGGDEKRRRLIVDLCTPSFLVPGTIDIPKVPIFNTDQQQVMEKVLLAEDYALVAGYPGTGKTTTMAYIVKTLVELGKSVLIATHSNLSLDNLLMKLRKLGVDLIRLGSTDKMLEGLRSCSIEKNPLLDTVEAIREKINSSMVMGTTCMGIHGSLLTKRTFDYCIIEEASQVTLPSCIGPLRFADKFVLMGDHYQLSPVVSNEKALEKGLGKSLFSILAQAHPQTLVCLEHQYRMNKEIMGVCNALIYDNKLKCGNASVANRYLRIFAMKAGMEKIHRQVPAVPTEIEMCDGESCWLKDIMHPMKKVVFLDTDALTISEEYHKRGEIQNVTELKLLYQLVMAFLAVGVYPRQLAVISGYRSQLRLANQYFRGVEGLEVATIDKYQGRDKDCVLISLVRSNTENNTGDLLKDWKRINVAFSRAKAKLIIVGSRSTLESSMMFKKLFDLLTKNNQIYSLPENAHLIHAIEPDLSNPTREKKNPKVFNATHAILNKNPILKEMHDSL